MDPEILNCRIMVIDDDPMSVAIMEEMLEERGFNTVTSITDPRLAVEKYAAFTPDLVLLDLNMPHLDGFAVMERLKKIDNHLPILVLTADDDRKARVKALTNGAKDYICKPFDEAETFTRICNMLEVRLLNNKLEEKVNERTRELHDTRLDIIRRLSLAAEYRDDDTGEHIVRMSRMCARLGKKVGLSDEEVDTLLSASPMHDVGKIGISDNLLLKPAKLTFEEFEIMKTHTTIGGHILGGSDVPLLVMARDIAMTHHEKWDGSGYPAGLKGEGIPLVGRITAICDVYDALTSERPYKKPWSVADSLEEIKRNVGKQFDPGLIEPFLSLVEE